MPLETDEQFVTYKGLRLPPQSVTLSKDLRYFLSGSMFRDALQRALKCKDTQVDFLWIVVSFEPVWQLYDFRDESLHVPWKDFVNKINSSTHETTTFSYALQVVEVVEFEYSGPPLMLIDEISITNDNDVTRTVPNTNGNVARTLQLASKSETEDWTRSARAAEREKK